jgi:hypothetical protein
MVLLGVLIELTGWESPAPLELLLQPEAGFHPLDGQGAGAAIAREDVMAHAGGPTPFKVSPRFAEDLRSPFGTGIGFIVNEE